MIRYNYHKENVPPYGERHEGYREGVDRVMVFIQSSNLYRNLEDEIEWAIKEGII